MHVPSPVLKKKKKINDVPGTCSSQENMKAVVQARLRPSPEATCWENGNFTARVTKLISFLYSQTQKLPLEKPVRCKSTRDNCSKGLWEVKQPHGQVTQINLIHPHLKARRQAGSF